jgi:hypothetical protein
MIRMFQILAVALAIAAAFFVWRGDLDTAFVIGVLAVCAFFLSIRFTYKSRVAGRETPADEDSSEPGESESKGEGE